MNLQEFKAWFEGFTDGMEVRPTEKQWLKIKSRVKEITPEPTTVRYFYDHYYNPYRSYTYGSISGSTIGYAGIAQSLGSSNQVYCQSNTNKEYASLSDFTALGQADKASI